MIKTPIQHISSHKQAFEFLVNIFVGYTLWYDLIICSNINEANQPSTSSRRITSPYTASLVMRHAPLHNSHSDILRPIRTCQSRTLRNRSISHWTAREREKERREEMALAFFRSSIRTRVADSPSRSGVTTVTVSWGVDTWSLHATDSLPGLERPDSVIHAASSVIDPHPRRRDVLSHPNNHHLYYTTSMELFFVSRIERSRIDESFRPYR